MYIYLYTYIYIYVPPEPPARVLSNGGAILGTSAGSEATWSLSEPVSSLDGFISHNWITPRFAKFLALALHFHFWPMVFTTLTVVACAFVLVATGMIGSCHHTSLDSDTHGSFACQAAAAVVMPVMLVFTSDIKLL